MANFSFSDVHTVDHMTHINNLESILANGLLPHGNTKQMVDISNQAVNQRRDSVEPIYGKKFMIMSLFIIILAMQCCIKIKKNTLLYWASIKNYSIVMAHCLLMVTRQETILCFQMIKRF